MSTNAVKLQLLTLMRIHLVVNISWIVQYREQVGGQKKEEGKPIEVGRTKEWEVEKILNKRKIRGVEKYLVRWKGFTAEYDIWKKGENLEYTKKVLEKFKRRINVEVRRQERLDIAEKREFRRGELPGKFIAKMLYG